MKITFHSCGLNKKYNIFENPLGNVKLAGESSTIINIKGNVCDFIYQTLKANDYDCCAIFALQSDGVMIYGHKSRNDIHLYEYDGPDVVKAIAHFQKEYKYKKYGLLQQINDTLYNIIVD